jgi:hypothetical protein
MRCCLSEKKLSVDAKCKGKEDAERLYTRSMYISSIHPCATPDPVSGYPRGLGINGASAIGRTGNTEHFEDETVRKEDQQYFAYFSTAYSLIVR